MKIVSISDLHIKSQEDEASKILMRFFRHHHTVSADAVFLLGDIFDLMVGPHATYEEQFSEFFSECEKIINSPENQAKKRGQMTQNAQKKRPISRSIKSNISKEM